MATDPPVLPARTPQRILKDVAEAYGLAVPDILGTKRGRYLSEARRACIQTIRAELPSMSWQEMGRLMLRDHTSLLYLARRIQK